VIAVLVMNVSLHPPCAAKLPRPQERCRKLKS
jgi:hypothetical protein